MWSILYTCTFTAYVILQRFYGSEKYLSNLNIYVVLQKYTGLARFFIVHSQYKISSIWERGQKKATKFQLFCEDVKQLLTSLDS